MTGSSWNLSNISEGYGLQMTLEELKQQRDELDARIAELEANEAGIIIPMNEEEWEKQHQEDLQRLRGLRLIDDDLEGSCCKFNGLL